MSTQDYADAVLTVFDPAPITTYQIDKSLRVTSIEFTDDGTTVIHVEPRPVTP